MYALQAANQGLHSDMLEWVAGLRVAAECSAAVSNLEGAERYWKQAIDALPASPTEFHAERDELKRVRAQLDRLGSIQEEERREFNRLRRPSAADEFIREIAKRPNTRPRTEQKAGAP